MAGTCGVETKHLGSEVVWGAHSQRASRFEVLGQAKIYQLQAEFVSQMNSCWMDVGMLQHYLGNGIIPEFPLRNTMNTSNKTIIGVSSTVAGLGLLELKAVLPAICLQSCTGVGHYKFFNNTKTLLKRTSTA